MITTVDYLTTFNGPADLLNSVLHNHFDMMCDGASDITTNGYVLVNEEPLYIEIQSIDTEDQFFFYDPTTDVAFATHNYAEAIQALVNYIEFVADMAA